MYRTPGVWCAIEPWLASRFYFWLVVTVVWDFEGQSHLSNAKSRSSRDFIRERRRRLRKRHLKIEVALLQTLSRLFHLVQFVKCWHLFLEVNSKRLNRSLGKEKESRCLVFTFSTKREIKHFHVVVQWRQRNIQKSVMHVQSCCFANLNQLLFCRSLWRRRRRCFSSLLLAFARFASVSRAFGTRAVDLWRVYELRRLPSLKNYLPADRRRFCLTSLVFVFFAG